MKNPLENKFSLKRIAWFCFAASILLQLIYISVCGTEQESDALGYVRLAERTVAEDTIYPSSQNIYSDYIFAPGYVNFLALLFRIFDSIKAIQFVNIGLMVVLILELFYLSRNYVNERVAYIVLLLFSFYPTTYGMIYYTLTDLFYVVLVFGAICLFVQQNWQWAFLAGITVAFANWVRPFLPVMFLVIIALTFAAIPKRYRIRNLTVFTIAASVCIMAIGTMTYSRIGYFNFQSTTSGVNLIMGANDDADGSYDPTVFEKGNIGHIADKDDKTFKERDAYWRSRGVSWILEHPGKWICLFPAKFFYMIVIDSYALGQFSGDVHRRAESREYWVGMLSSFPHWGILECLVVYNQLFYMICLCLSLYGIVLAIKSKNFIILALVLYWFLGTALTLATVGGARYHYPYMPVIFLLTAVAVDNIINKYRSKLG